MEKETAMEILRKLHDSSLFAERTALETLIPELADSNAEKIRKALIRFHKSTIDIDGIKGDDIIAWLEKQGEQNTADKSATTKQEDEIEIQFGAKDSELIEERYYISEGCYVEVRDGYVAIKKSDENKEE